MMSARTARGLVWLAALVPVIFFLFGLRAGDLASPAALLNAAGRLSGAAGLALLLLAAILSARVPGFDRPFGGLTKLWRTHHLLGAWALVLLMLHPVLLALSASDQGVQAAFGTLFPEWSDYPTWSGWLALVTMMTFLAPSFSFFGPPRYERWKRIHRLAGPAVVFALVHTYYLSRTMPAWLDGALWSLLAVLAVAAVAWRFVFSRRIGRLAYQVSTVDPVANNVVELTLAPKHRHLAYEPGNFVYLAAYDRRLAAGYGEEHPYTLSSSPLEPDLRITIKDLGDASRAMQAIEPGAEVTVEGPYGRFFEQPDRVETPELWVAGGIGITPFLARARHLLRLGGRANVRLIYCVQDEARALFADELAQIAQQLPGLDVRPHYFYRHGPVSLEFLQDACPDLAQREIHICGPIPLNNLVQRHARAVGIPRTRIRTEEFELI